ncbi:cell wall protein DAN4 [Fopius arisanus]|uniref:Cell wall protein DAN4 n=1 Tax=Fopius arisanus TaxID=64838 RepID=A0A0C9REN9_9HYME|nr:PREDICTED: cell wall protein DAN4 [Fopius arisanus]
MGRAMVFMVWGFMGIALAHPGADPEILPGSDLTNFSGFPVRQTPDPRVRLSSTQQQQILTDVQQHQLRYNFPGNSHVTFPQPQLASKSDAGLYPSLAKYRVDRTKSSTERPFPQTAQYSIPQFSSSLFPNFPSATDLPSTYYNDASSISLQSYYEKQRELDLLRKQREQLILEQNELRRQQELLRQQQLKALTSTTTSTTPATTSASSLLLSSPTSRRITPAESELFLKAIATHQKKFTTTAKPLTASLTPLTSPKPQEPKLEEPQDIPKDLLQLIQAQNPQLIATGKNKPQIKIIYQTEKPATRPSKSKTSEKDQLLRQLKLALAENSDDEKNVTTRDLVLPNGRKLQIIQAPNGLSSIVPNEGSSQFQTVTQALDLNASSTTTVKPAKTVLEELTKGVLPPGADFEVLRHKDDGKLEDVARSTIQGAGKKVTFVVLEEQSDGTFKVQGVKGNSKEDGGVDVESIVEKIKKGEIKLPPSSKSPREPKGTTKGVTKEEKATTIKYTGLPSSAKIRDSSSDLSADYSPRVTVTPKSVSQLDNYVTSASTQSANIFNSISTFNPTTARSPSTAYRSISTTIHPPRSHFIPTMAPVSEIISTTHPPVFTTSYGPQSSSYVHFASSTVSPIPRGISSTEATSLNSAGASENLIFNDLGGNSGASFEATTPGDAQPLETIANLLRREGLFAMAKYLRQSGLDTVLNETGPYTIFVPTDKAFRTLLVQLGGPEKAEQKFKENPRLLSGLLLHHVIPGAFRIDSLQDEMTGVSLAGTQLRVNVYDMHDQEWNDVKVTTINGARVAPNKRDIEIPQGIAHAVDRVMFPLPVGDLTQTLAADREQRFGTFLRILHASGLEDTLAGTKTFTVFAPTDSAFAAAASNSGRGVWTDGDGPELAKNIISRHIIPTTMYTAGMRFYHQKDTLRPQFTLRIQKNGGRVKVNEAQVLTHNIPATNGVIHAIDSML